MYIANKENVLTSVGRISFQIFGVKGLKDDFGDNGVVNDVHVLVTKFMTMRLTMSLHDAVDDDDFNDNIHTLLLIVMLITVMMMMMVLIMMMMFMITIMLSLQSNLY